MSLGARKTTSKTMVALSWLGRNGHFLLAMSILGAVGGAIAMLGWVVKMPVPWPEGVVVDKQFRLLSLPARFGPYVRVAKDGLFSKADGKADGENIFKPDDVRSLGLGSTYDKARYPHRRSNWYVSRIYEDERISDERHPHKFWRLDVTYYTGLRGKVPHVSERCLWVAGATVLSRKPVAFRAPQARKPWDQYIDFQRVYFELGRPGEIPTEAVDYYVFSLNGKPERSWEYVRLKLSLPMPRYIYFAKIQFSPMARSRVDTVEGADEAAAEFIKHALPGIVQMLPSAEDIDRVAKTEERDKT